MDTTPEVAPPPAAQPVMPAAPNVPALPIVPPERWRPVIPKLRSYPSSRSPELLVQVCAQFGVEHAARYQPDEHTYCNIFATDCTTAMMAQIPHSIDLDGSPCPIGHGSELRANGTVDWLVKYGPAYGWNECDAGAARGVANKGWPAVACWKNPLPGHSGHIAMILPDVPGGRGLVGPMIAQAGQHCLFNVPLSHGFGDLAPPALRFFMHV